MFFCLELLDSVEAELARVVDADRVGVAGKITKSSCILK